MNKQIVSDKQAISTLILFIIGSSSVFTMGMLAEQDLWIAIILAIFMALPMSLIYARIHYIFPNKDLFDIIEICFGKIIGKGLIILFTCFVFYWASDILVNYGNFIYVVSLTKTPKIVPMMMLGILCGIGIKKGIEALGRWSEFFLIIPIILLLTTTVLLIPQMNIDNIKPVLYKGMRPIFKGAFNAFSFPFSQLMAFTMVFSSFKRKKSPYKIYTIGLFIGGIYLLILSLTNLLVLGVSAGLSFNYSSYVAISRINLGGVLQRIEVFVAIIFVLGGFIKISIVLLCTCKGIIKLFNFTNYKFIVTPVTLLMINLSYFQYESVPQYSEFQTEIWAYFTFPFHVILPVIILIAAEIKKKRVENY